MTLYVHFIYTLILSHDKNTCIHGNRRLLQVPKLLKDPTYKVDQVNRKTLNY